MISLSKSNFSEFSKYSWKWFLAVPISGKTPGTQPENRWRTHLSVFWKLSPAFQKSFSYEYLRKTASVSIILSFLQECVLANKSRSSLLSIYLLLMKFTLFTIRLWVKTLLLEPFRDYPGLSVSLQHNILLTICCRDVFRTTDIHYGVF